MTKDINKAQFDEATQMKLFLFKSYFKAWLSIFLIGDHKKIEVYDFFAGSGTDSKGAHGSPLIILDVIKEQCETIAQKRIALSVYLNEFEKDKASKLNSTLDEYFKECKSNFCSMAEDKCPFQRAVDNKDFDLYFDGKYPEFFSKTVPRFMLLDQYGIKYGNAKVFGKLLSIKMADFLLFVSSSFLKRFATQPEFAKYLENKEFDFKNMSFPQSHRIVYQYYKSLIPRNKEYYLGQFSLKKGSNYYGLIFGSNHPRGLEKFLESAWKADSVAGDANFDIDDDPIRSGQPSLFADNNKPNKIKEFEDNLVNWLGEGGKGNKEVYLFSLENGISISKANERLRALEKEERIEVIISQGAKRQKGAFYLKFKPEKEILIKNAQLKNRMD